ncbi:MAG: SH3 domain-containing protein [Chloroflexi bacterium]|nr:SH3 domain-containing protein [Chloroflexota bacterium]
MSDDFNELRPRNEDDDDRFDWEADDSEDQPADDSLGFTGELSWRQDVEKAFNDQSDDAGDESYDWRRGQANPPGSGEPDLEALFGGWQGQPAAPEGDDAGSPDWLAGFTDDETGDEAEPEVSLPPWLREDAGEPAQASADEPLPGGDLPPWLADMTEPAAPQPPLDVPPWLREDAPVEPPAAQTGDLPAWLDNPDLPAEEAEPIPGGDVPPWLAGLDEPSEPEPALTDDDLLAGLDEALGLVEPPAAAAPDWVPSFDLPDEAPTEAQPPTGLDAYLVDEEVDEEFFAEAPAEREELPDWLTAAAPTAEQPAEPVAGDLFSGWTAAPDDEPEEAAEAADMPDWLAAAAPRDEEPAEAEPAAFDDWLPAPAESAAPEEQPAGDEMFTDWEAVQAAFEEDTEAESEAAPAADMPDWLAATAPTTGQTGPTEAKDIFGELGLPTPETGYDFLDQPTPQEDVDLPDWFAQPEASAEPNWLDELGEADVSQTEAEEAAAPADADMLAALRDLTGASEKEEVEARAPAFDDLDSLLASYEAPAATPEDRALLDTRMDDIDRLLSDEDLEQIAARRAPRPATPEITPETPDWLTESGVFVGGTSAAAILRRQVENERPLEELDDRLRALHEQGLELPAPAEETPSGDLQTLLPGVNQLLPPAPIKTGLTGIAGEVVLLPQQADKIRLLRSLVATEAVPAPRPPSALDLTYESPSFADLLEDEGEPAPEEPIPAPRPARRLKLGRLVIALLVAAGVALPFFVGPLRVGNLPPAQFGMDSRQQAAFAQMDTVPPGSSVLVAAEYGPTGAAELDSLTEALLRHVLLKGARPVIVSTNPLGLLHVQNIMDRLASDEDFAARLNRRLVANRDYTIVRYLAGSVVGLRAFSENIPGLLATDINGNPTHSALSSLRDFALIVVIAERADDLRSWAEQVAPLARKPLVGAVGFAAAPLAEPYSLTGFLGDRAGVRGLLVGYGDAYTYRAQLDAVAPVAPDRLPTQPPATLPPTEPVSTPLPSLTPAGAEQPVEATPTSPAPTLTATVDIPVVAPTTAATATEVPAEITAAPATPEATAGAQGLAPEATAEIPATPTALPVIIGVVDAGQSVNVREGPGRTFAPVGAARPGQRLQILGRNGAGDWLQVRLEDGREGWIAASLIRIEGPATPTPETGAGVDPYAVVGLISDVDVIAFQATATPEATAAVRAQDLAPEATAEIPGAQDVSVGPPMPYRDERWYGMTLGLIVIIAVIAIGTVVNVIGSLFRRRQR